jgi:hypothetical protein
MGGDLPSAVVDEVVRELARTWVHVNAMLFRGAMRPCGIAVEAMGPLGRWEGDRRRIVVSPKLILDYSWLDVVEVFKHEMAHQFVTEVLQVTDETAHGPAFRKVCADRGIDARAAAPPADIAEPAVERIRKLLALSESPNVHEAEAALEAALRLLRRHGLRRDDVAVATEEVSYRQLGRVRARVPKHEQLLAGALTRQFGVQAIWTTAFDVLEGRAGTVMELVGRSEQLDLVEHMFAVVLRAAERDWIAHRRRHGISSDRDRRRFLEGVVIGFDKKLQQDDRTLREEGLIPADDPLVEAWFQRRHPRVRTRSMSVALDAAHRAGRAAGEALEVKPALRGASSGPLGISGPVKK